MLSTLSATCSRMISAAFVISSCLVPADIVLTKTADRYALQNRARFYRTRDQSGPSFSNHEYYFFGLRLLVERAAADSFTAICIILAPFLQHRKAERKAEI